MEDLNATCIICGTKYHCCLSCKEQMSFKPWRTITDSIEHYKIFIVLSDYNNGITTKEDAKKQLENISYDIGSLKPEVQDQINEIISEKKSKNK